MKAFPISCTFVLLLWLSPHAESQSCSTTGTVNGGGPVCLGDSATVTVSVNGGTSPYTVALNNGGGTLAGRGPSFSFSVSPSSTTTYSVDPALSHDTANCPIIGNGSAAVTVNQNPATPTITAMPSQVCANSAGNSARGPAGAASYSWTITNGTITSATNVQTINYTAGPSGDIGLTLRISNGSGCTASNSKNVPIPMDSTPPTISCPSNIIVTAIGNCPTHADFTVVASDNCPGLNLVADPPFGSAFPVGTNMVRVMATDAAGNTNTCSFTVTVLPGPAPKLDVARVGTNVILSWPKSVACYNLESTPRLLSPPASNIWTTYTGPRETNGTSFVVTESLSNISNRFYRLSY